MRSLLRRLYWKAESIITPGQTSSQYTYYRILRELVAGTRWLDLGCGHQVFAEWMTQEQDEVIRKCRVIFGIDRDWIGLLNHSAIQNKIFGDLTALPVRCEALTLVTANMVVEHLDEPEAVLAQVRRVLKQGGRFVFHTSNYNSWPIRVACMLPDGLKKRIIWITERRKEEDVFKTHYRMNTIRDIRALAAKARFEVEGITTVSTSAATQLLGPVAWIELLYNRWLWSPKRQNLRSNIVAVLRKPYE